MSQYSFTSPTPGDPSDYREWLIDAPTSRCIDCAVMGASIAKGMSCEGRRLSLGADSHGDNWTRATARIEVTTAHIAQPRLSDLQPHSAVHRR